MVNKFEQHNLCRFALSVSALAYATACGDLGELVAPLEESVVAHSQSLTGECDLAGTWALKFVVPVRWSANPGIQAGQGEIVQYARTERTRTGMVLTDVLKVCGNTAPDYQSTATLGPIEHYGIAFQDSLFDSDVLSPVSVEIAMSGFTLGSTFASSPAAIEMGVKMGNPVSDIWPRKIADLQHFLVDADGDGKPGVTVLPKTGGDYVAPPTGLGKAARAKAFYTAVRNVATTSGTLTHCDRVVADVTIPTMGGKAAINSHVLGCEKLNGAACSAFETSIIDGFQPGYQIAAPPQVTMVRVDSATTCAQIRHFKF